MYSKFTFYIALGIFFDSSNLSASLTKDECKAPPEIVVHTNTGFAAAHNHSIIQEPDKMSPNPLEKMNEQHIRHIEEKAAIEQKQLSILIDLENKAHTQKLKIRKEEFKQHMDEQERLHQYQMTVDKEKREIHQKKQQTENELKKAQYAILRAQQKRAAEEELEKKKEADRVYFEQKAKEQKEKDLELQRQKQKNEEDIEDVERKYEEEKQKEYEYLYKKYEEEHKAIRKKIKKKGLREISPGASPHYLTHNGKRVGVNPGRRPTYDSESPDNTVYTSLLSDNVERSSKPKKQSNHHYRCPGSNKRSDAERGNNDRRRNNQPRINSDEERITCCGCPCTIL